MNKNNDINGKFAFDMDKSLRENRKKAQDLLNQLVNKNITVKEASKIVQGNQAVIKNWPIKNSAITVKEMSHRTNNSWGGVKTYANGNNLYVSGAVTKQLSKGLNGVMNTNESGGIYTAAAIAARRYVSSVFRSPKYSYNSKLTKVVKEFRKQIGNHKENLSVANILMHNGWISFEFFRPQILKDNYGKTKSEVLDYIEHYYCDNGFANFFRIFDLIVNGFYEESDYSDGYAQLVKSIEMLVRQNFDNYKMVINAVISIIEYACSIKFNLIMTDGFVNSSSISDKRKKYVDKFEEGKNRQNGVISQIDMLSIFQVLKDTWGKKSFKVGIENTAYGRGPIQHGRYDPDRLKKTDFVKLIVLLFGIMLSPKF